MIMAKTANLNIRLDPNTKIIADGIFSRFGITISDAVNIFLNKAIMIGGLPFDMTLPQYNEETLIAMQEARDISSGKTTAKGYTSLAELNAELDAEYELEYGSRVDA
jgi:DNA-damage-inducible protein J